MKKVKNHPIKVTYWVFPLVNTKFNQLLCPQIGEKHKSCFAEKDNFTMKQCGQTNITIFSQNIPWSLFFLSHNRLLWCSATVLSLSTNFLNTFLQYFQFFSPTQAIAFTSHQPFVFLWACYDGVYTTGSPPVAPTFLSTFLSIKSLSHHYKSPKFDSISTITHLITWESGKRRWNLAKNV